MPEFYKRVMCSQFLPTEAQRADVAKGNTASWEGQPIKGSGNPRLHILLPIADRLFPVRETDWIVRDSSIEIYSDNDFKAKFIRYDNTDPIALQAKLEQVVADRKQ